MHVVPYYVEPKSQAEDAEKSSKKKDDKKEKREKEGGHIEFMVIASDGIWGWTSNEQVVRLIRRKLRESVEDGDAKGLAKRTEYICQDLVQLAMDNGSTDNITVIVVVFNNTAREK